MRKPGRPVGLRGKLSEKGITVKMPVAEAVYLAALPKAERANFIRETLIQAIKLTKLKRGNKL